MRVWLVSLRHSAIEGVPFRAFECRDDAEGYAREMQARLERQRPILQGGVYVVASISFVKKGESWDD